ncbi:helix-turn-helix domain-containing protein (plasmid) [Sulfitobacter pontiacus]|uniref:IclR family transcriptional regulator n=1 Tax=Sulfitobacter pontiacus TaxID=60137 RepID=UPI002AC98F7D|nr:helix-turn-helix domain-containing protein [Sulfitobacter pontiacus]WPZ27585.1 helix-turn-helix domain-containing protein [Sulfitobacter pontiacus]
MSLFSDGKGLPTAPSARSSDTQTSVKSALRAVQVFEFFLEIRRSATAKEVSVGLDIPQSSTSMLLRSLRDHGYLDYDSKDRTYLPTPRVTLLGAWLDRGPIRDGRLIDALKWLSDQTLEAIIVAARVGIFSHYIYVMQAKGNLRYHIPMGSRRLAVHSATGHVLLSRLEDSEIASIVRRTNSEIDDVQLDPRETIGSIRQTRTDGYAFSRGLVTAGAGAIAVPLPEAIDTTGRALAICIAGALPDLIEREDDLVEKLKSAAKRAVGEVAA